MKAILTPKCPYCGGEMKPNTGTGHNIHGNKTVWFTYCCDVCESESPPCDSRAEAYAAAMRRDRMKGEWINEDVDWVCSVCGHDAYTEGDYRQVRTNFCPNCGADMREHNNE